MHNPANLNQETTCNVMEPLLTDQMLKFTSTERQMPRQREAELRKTDFNEIYERFAEQTAASQAARCSQCGVPFCQDHCPLQNNIPDWLKLVAEGRLKEAYEISSATNSMPEVCGRICPQDRLCEGSCVIEQSGHGTVTIGAVEQYITDTAWQEGWITPIRPSCERHESVGIIGAGPGGLAAAQSLRQEGYQVSIYDRYDRVGGLLTYGIPNFKLEKTVVERRRELLIQSGVQFILNVEIGKDISFDSLRHKHSAIIIATGVYKARSLECPGVGSQGVVAALEFLTASNRKGLGDHVEAFDSGTLNASRKRVVVIGGGDTAMDCVRTAVRQGALSVTCLYRRDRANMPGSAREVRNAEEEGVTFEWLATPKSIIGDIGAVHSVSAVRMRLGDMDESGRARPMLVEGSDFQLEADLVIEALGFEPEDVPQMFNVRELTTTRRGTLKVHPTTLETALENVYAVGDIVRGASLVVWAIRDGHVAAEAIHQSFLSSVRTEPIQRFVAE